VGGSKCCEEPAGREEEAFAHSPLPFHSSLLPSSPLLPPPLAGVPEGVESDKGEFMNHSCSPNSIFLNDDYMVAIRTIEPDEEVTYDYAMSETNTSSHMPFNCACGFKECRGTITGYDLLKPEVRMKYGSYLFTSNARRFQAKYEAGGVSVPEGVAGLAAGPKGAGAGGK
jgi:hypothetical protein